MSNDVLIALIVGLPPTLLALASLITSIRAKAKLEVIHGQINGMKDELVRATGAEKLAEGEAVGREKAAAERVVRIAESERVEDRQKGMER